MALLFCRRVSFLPRPSSLGLRVPPLSILFAAGGSGGHLFPAIAVAEELSSRNADVVLALVTSDKPIDQIVTCGVQWERVVLPVRPPSSLRRSPWQFLRRNWQAWREALRMIDVRRPAVVVGCGGFASVPLLLAARSRRVPIVLLEQNAFPGRVTRWLGRAARVICCSDPASLAHLPSRKVSLIQTGNPVRREITALADRTPDEVAAGRTLLILGGSQGSHALNKALMEMVEASSGTLHGWNIVHQTGEKDRVLTEEAYKAAGVQADVQAFASDMAPLYRKAALAVTRAGGTTLAELACAGVPSILVPYPQAADDHQRANAETFRVAGGSVVVEQRRPDFSKALAAEIQSLLVNEPGRRRMSAAVRQLAAPKAAVAVADIILQVARR